VDTGWPQSEVIMSDEEGPAKSINKNQVLNLPVHAERYCFGCSWNFERGESKDYDLSAVLIGKNGELIDAVYYG